MQENIVITGGKETRTYGINANTGKQFISNFYENVTNYFIYIDVNVANWF